MDDTHISTDTPDNPACQDIQVELLALFPDKDNTLNRRAIRNYHGERIHVDLRSAILQPADNPAVISLHLAAIYTVERFPFPETLLTMGATARFRISAARGTSATDTSSWDTDANIYTRGGTLHLPHHLLTLMLGTALGALRGIIANHTAATPLRTHPLPLINIASLASSLGNVSE